MTYYLDPKNDLAFKRTIGRNKDLCLNFLNNILPLKRGRRINQLSYQPYELVPEIPLLNNSLVDVCCIDNLGCRFFVKIQIQWTNDFKRRVLLNGPKACLRQLDAGMNYRILHPVYSLNFTIEAFDPYPNVYYHDYKIVTTENGNRQIKGLELIFIELPKYRPVSACHQMFDFWMMFLANVNEGMQKAPELLMKKRIIKRALECLERDSYTKYELELYNRVSELVRNLQTGCIHPFSEDASREKQATEPNENP